MTKDDSISVDKYIARFPDDVQEVLKQIRQIIVENVEDMTEGISYQMPAVYTPSSNSPLLYYAAWKDHVALYPAYEAPEGQEDRFAEYRGTKNSLHFDLRKPIPVDVVKDFVKFKLAEANL